MASTAAARSPCSRGLSSSKQLPLMPLYRRLGRLPRTGRAGSGSARGGCPSRDSLADGGQPCSQRVAKLLVPVARIAAVLVGSLVARVTVRYRAELDDLGVACTHMGYLWSRRR
jgi:hypothetical protein